MKYRMLQMAWSVGWGLPCLLLAALWIRSESYVDVVNVRATATQTFAVASTPGVLWITPEGTSTTTNRVGYHVQPAGHWVDVIKSTTPGYQKAAFDYLAGWVKIPYWFLVPFFAALAAMPWFHWSKQFSLRTLLLGMTLVAVGLGWIVYAIRS